jgi:hypothetical protein
MDGITLTFTVYFRQDEPQSGSKGAFCSNLKLKFLFALYIKYKDNHPNTQKIDVPEGEKMDTMKSSRFFFKTKTLLAPTMFLSDKGNMELCLLLMYRPIMTDFSATFDHMTWGFGYVRRFVQRNATIQAKWMVITFIEYLSQLQSFFAR